jgi:hypothetical protein
MVKKYGEQIRRIEINFGRCKGDGLGFRCSKHSRISFRSRLIVDKSGVGSRLNLYTLCLWSGIVRGNVGHPDGCCRRVNPSIYRYRAKHPKIMTRALARKLASIPGRARLRRIYGPWGREPARKHREHRLALAVERREKGVRGEFKARPRANDLIR